VDTSPEEARGFSAQDGWIMPLPVLYQFLSPFITVHHRLRIADDDFERLEPFAPKHPSWFFAGDER